MTSNNNIEIEKYFDYKPGKLYKVLGKPQRWEEYCQQVDIKFAYHLTELDYDDAGEDAIIMFIEKGLDEDRVAEVYKFLTCKGKKLEIYSPMIGPELKEVNTNNNNNKQSIHKT